MLLDGSLVFGGFSLQLCVTAADSIGPGVANATEHTRVLKSDYVAFEASAATRSFHEADKIGGRHTVFVKIRYASALPFDGNSLSGRRPNIWTGAETYLEVFR